MFYCYQYHDWGNMRLSSVHTVTPSQAQLVLFSYDITWAEHATEGFWKALIVPLSNWWDSDSSSRNVTQQRGGEPTVRGSI